MKFFIAFLLILIVFDKNCYSQCPQPGLKIRSTGCDSPSNLSVNNMTCSVLKVKWQGKQNQSYIVKAIGLDPITSKTYEAEASKYSCDNNGNCIATIPIREGTNVSLSVQGICTEGGATIYGYKMEGKEAYIPICKQVTNTTSKLLRAYPNPTTGDLTVGYNGSVTSNTTFSIFDISGKKAFTISGDAVTRTDDGYKINLHGLISGSYLLKVSNGKEESRTKFVLIRN
ncbi:MAG: hypothetical protein JWQ09_4548 [Segetibacter sp.]|nr:hypothetical protein [Segetibacter sp.]